MTCDNCAETVMNTLKSIKGIENAEVTLNPAQVIITMKHHIQTSDMNRILSEHGNYFLEETNGKYSDSAPVLESESGEKSFFAVYKPILLVFSYLIIAGVLKIVYDGSFNLMNFMQIFMGGFFLVFSFFKLLDLKGFAYSYMTYDILAKKWIEWGYIYPFVELLLGLAYLFHFKPAVTNITTVVIMSLSSIGVIQSLLNKRKIQCACLGTVFNLPMSNITLIEDSLMILMAVVSLSV